MKKIGFVVNPIAGMGGTVGLKGTDGEEILLEARRRGAKPSSTIKAVKALQNLAGQKKLWFLTCSSEMGEDSLKKSRIENYEVVYTPPKKTTAMDTKKACTRFLEKKVDLVLFCGGDGTARDIFEVIGQKVPIIGIPAGVKMHSAVFTINPHAIRELLMEYFSNNLSTREGEIMDIDEEKYRKGIWSIKLFGYALTPYKPTLVQTRKFLFEREDEKASKREIARYMLELLEKDTTYILGAGTTVKEITDLLDLEKTLLGVDIMRNKKMLAIDVNEREILSHIKSNKARVVVSPIGAQGFIFGRGNQQLSPRVIKKVGVENIMIIATPYKLSETPVLHVDTGVEELDNEFRGYQRIITGYHKMTMKKIE